LALKVGELFATLGLDTTQFSNKLNQAKSGLSSAGKRMEGIGKSMTAKVTAPIVGVGAAAVHTVMGFDDSMSKVKAISGATGKEFEQLREQAKDLGSTTAFSASEAADAMGYLALAGWDTQQIMAATPDMLNLASAASMDLATAADIVSDTMSAFGMEAEEAGKASDVFAAASANANTDVHQLGEAMKYASANAHAAGMDLEQTSAVMGILADNGIKGSKAGTTFNAMLRDMRNASDEGAIAIGDHSVALYDQEGNMRDLGSVMADVEKATKGMSTEQRDAALGAIFGEQAIKGVNIMLEEGADKYSELESAMYDANGTAGDMADEMQDNIGGAFREMKSAIEGFLIEVGDHLAPHIRKAAEFIGSLARKFSDLPGPVKSAIIIFAGVLAAIGPILFIGGKLIALFGTLMTVFKAVGAVIAAVTSPIGLVVAAIVALIAIGWYLYKNWDQVWEWVTNVIASARETLSNIAESIRERVSEAIENLRENIVSIVNNMRERWLAIFENIKNGILERANTIKTSVIETVDSAMEFIRNLPSKALEWGKAIIQGLIDGVWNMAGNLGGAIKGVAEGAIDGAKKFFGISSPSKEFEKIGNSLGEGLSVGLSKAKRFINDNVERMAKGTIDIANRSHSMAHSGVITVEGVNNEGELVAVANYFMDQVTNEIKKGDRNLPKRPKYVPS